MDSQNSIWVLRLPVELQPFLAASPNSYLAARTVDDIRLTIIWFNQGIYEKRINAHIDGRSQSSLNREQGTIPSLISSFFPFTARNKSERETNQPTNEETESTAAISALKQEEKEFSARIKSPRWLEEFDRPSLRKVSHPGNRRSNWIGSLLQVRKSDLKSVRSCLINHKEDGQPEYSTFKIQIPKDAEEISGPRKAELKCLLRDLSQFE
ncbi:MAG: hypothetical protein LQ342_008118 [Letrouitia transgressa]|nr:MAG: hypothetical protein LQ342_008118 [Letrouitia transgressa]